MLVIAGVRDTYAAFGSQLKKDLIGDGSQKGFIWWIAAILIVGSIGYVEKLKPFATGFLVLIIVAMVINDKGGVFKKFTEALTQGPIEPTSPAQAQAQTSQPAGGTGTQAQPQGSSGNALGDISAAAQKNVSDFFTPSNLIKFLPALIP